MRARPPQPRDSSFAHHLTTGPEAEGGGGWPLHATAQPWHAEGRPLPAGALRRLQSLADLDGRTSVTLRAAKDPDEHLITSLAYSRSGPSRPQRPPQLREALLDTQIITDEPRDL